MQKLVTKIFKLHCVVLCQLLCHGVVYRQHDHVSYDYTRSHPLSRKHAPVAQSPTHHIRAYRLSNAPGTSSPLCLHFKCLNMPRVLLTYTGINANCVRVARQSVRQSPGTPKTIRLIVRIRTIMRHRAGIVTKYSV